MTTPPDSRIRAARRASAQMADCSTPLIRREWYVAAFSDEVGRTLLRRTILNRPVVFFRTKHGQAIALEDRCAHRSYPLSRGTLEDDTVVCGYHGLRYDTNGDCLEIPSQRRCPKGIGVRAYPLREQGSLIWIWMGADPVEETPSLPPDCAWLTEPDWVTSTGYFHLKASYILLHENLLDLTHLSFLHARTFGTPDYAKAPYTVANSGSRFELTRQVAPTRLPPVWQRSTGLDTDQAARVTRSAFCSPGLHVVSGTFFDTRAPAAQRSSFEIKTAHIPTPETQTTTHYFIVHGRNFAQSEDWVTSFMHEQLFRAFDEDVVALDALQENLSLYSADSYEFSIQSDEAAIAMRKYLKVRAHSEAAPPATTDAMSISEIADVDIQE